MKSKEKILKFFIAIIGIVCLYAFLSIRIQPMYNFVLQDKIIPGYWDKTKYGELFYFNHINHFKEDLPAAKTKFQYKPKHSKLNESDIITFGDSFFDFSRNKQFSERLNDNFGFKVHLKKGDGILAYLENSKYDTTKARVLIYERTERWIPLVFGDSSNFYYLPETKETNNGIAKKVKDYIFPEDSEKLYDAMLRRSYATSAVYSSIATLKFDLFKYISPYTPKYYLKDTIPWLFYYDQVNDEPTSFYYKHSNKEMDIICRNIAYLSNTLKDKYNITFVFLPLPAKYTMYHNILNSDEYNNFMLKLYDCLDRNGILYIDVYEDFANEEIPVYYGTDEHWRENGISIAFNKTLDLLKKDSVTSKILFNQSKSYR